MSDNLTTDDCIEALRDVADQIGNSPTYSEYCEVRTSPHPNTISRKFGSWNEAKVAANLDVCSTQKDMNVNYFNEIDTPRKAYWMGLFFADGWVSGGSFGIKLKASDGYLLETLKSDLESEHKIREVNPDEPNWSVMCDFKIGIPEFIESLSSHGLDGEKTESDSLPELSDELRPHFVRGMFDGDGTISFHRESNHCQITGISPERFEVMAEWIPFETRIYQRGNGAVDLSIPSEYRVSFFNYIYPDGSDTAPKLARKFCTFQQYI